LEQLQLKLYLLPLIGGGLGALQGSRKLSGQLLDLVGLRQLVKVLVEQVWLAAAESEGVFAPVSELFGDEVPQVPEVDLLVLLEALAVEVLGLLVDP